MSEDKKEAEKLDLKTESEKHLKTMKENEPPQRAAGIVRGPTSADCSPAGRQEPRGASVDSLGQPSQKAEARDALLPENLWPDALEEAG